MMIIYLLVLLAFIILDGAKSYMVPVPLMRRYLGWSEATAFVLPEDHCAGATCRGVLEPFTSGLYAFAVEVNGGAGLVVDGITVFDSLNETTEDLGADPRWTSSKEIYLETGEVATFSLELKAPMGGRILVRTEAESTKIVPPAWHFCQATQEDRVPGRMTVKMKGETITLLEAATTKEGIFVILMLALYFFTFFYFVDKIIQINFFHGNL